GMDPKNAIEAVYIPDKGRGTLCVSSQVGCALNCSFCSTATQGFNRNLTTSEVIGQVWVAARQLGNLPHQRRKLTNVVMMGMGEACDVSLAVSLHAPNDALRTGLVPLNRKYPIAQLMDACVRYALRKKGTSVTFEYTLMKGVNDQPQHARELARLMRGFDNAV